MRRLILLAVFVLLSACARSPRPAPTTTEPPGPMKPHSGLLIGLTAAELGQRFGQPSFQVREGTGTKLQWSQNGCVLDAYLYPPDSGRGVERVTHVDTRNRSGADVALETCQGLLAR